MVRFLISGLIAVGLSVAVLGTPQSQPNSRQHANRPDSASDVKVWVNLSSGVYHCPGSRWYGATSRGEYMTQKQAKDHGYRAANGKVCTASGNQPALPDNIALSQPVGQCGFNRWPVKILSDQDR